jgi:chromosome partitioning protein
MPRAKTISFINYKGGVGKTTTTYHIGCSLAQHHTKKVLLVDIDAQTNLTFLCAAPEKWEEFKRRAGTIATMYKRFLDRKALDTKRFIWRTPIEFEIYGRRHRIPNLDLIPCDVDLLGEDLGGGQLMGTFPSLEALKRQASEYLRERKFLQNALREVEDDYHYILIDCPPNLYLMTQNALVASDWYVITAIPDHLSTIGLTILDRKVNKIGELIDSAQTLAGESERPAKVAGFGGIIFVKIRIGGSLVTNTHFDRMQRVSSMFGNNACFSTYTTELIGFSEAAENNLPVWMHASPNAKRAARKHEYEQITEEFLRRF